MIPFHPLADIFPLIEGDEFDALVDDIRGHGVREPVVLHEGAILDGRNRYRASQAAGIFVGDAGGRLINCVQFDPDPIKGSGDPLAFVLSRNLRRRHLNESQRAMVAARLANIDGPGQPQKNSANLRNISQSAAAAMLSVSPRSVTDAAKVKADAQPEIVKAVDHGRLAVSAGAKASTLAPDQQREIADLAGKGDANAVRKVIKQATRTNREAHLGARQEALPDRRFGVILADPEWRFEPWSRETGLDRSPDNHYPTSALEVIAARDVASIAAPDSILWLWATVPMLPHALVVMGAWGFNYVSHIVWNKDRQGTGYWFINKHEILLVGTRGNIPAPAPGTQWLSAITAPRSQHSAKPEIFLELIEQYFPTLPKIELNRRGPARKGWEAWGNESSEAPAGAEMETV